VSADPSDAPHWYDANWKAEHDGELPGGPLGSLVLTCEGGPLHGREILFYDRAGVIWVARGTGGKLEAAEGDAGQPPAGVEGSQLLGFYGYDAATEAVTWHPQPSTGPSVP
jgi:hypothetical protein